MRYTNACVCICVFVCLCCVIICVRCIYIYIYSIRFVFRVFTICYSSNTPRPDPFFVFCLVVDVLTLRSLYPFSLASPHTHIVRIYGVTLSFPLPDTTFFFSWPPRPTCVVHTKKETKKMDRLWHFYPFGKRLPGVTFSPWRAFFFFEWKQKIHLVPFSWWCRA